jgi:hypothetical protein
LRAAVEALLQNHKGGRVFGVGGHCCAAYGCTQRRRFGVAPP